MELPVANRVNDLTASTCRLLPRSGMVEECDGCVHQAGAAATCLCRLHSPLVGSRTRDLRGTRCHTAWMVHGTGVEETRASGRERDLKHGG
ncbi:hypothetical protein FQN60_013815, partial [Etheostoma spectabile]